MGTKKVGPTIEGDEARIAMGMKFSQEEFDELTVIGHLRPSKMKRATTMN